MPWYKIADIFTGNDLMMVMLIEEILKKDEDSWDKIAVYIWKTYNLNSKHHAKHHTRNAMQSKVELFNDFSDILPADAFGPVTSEDCLSIPDSCEVIFISTD